MDPESIAPLVTKKTRAILPVHIHGQPCDMPRILQVARKHGVPVVEDGKLVGMLSAGDVMAFEVSSAQMTIEQMQEYIHGRH